MAAPVPPVAVRGNDWRSLDPPPPDDFHPTIPVTVVIPYYETPEALRLTLAALENQTYPRSLFEVVIVDDGSAAPLRAAPSSPLQVRIFRQEDRGFGAARARNCGARAANHPILVFLDSDMLPETSWLASHARWHHTASDVLTLGFRAHVDVEGLTPAAVRDRIGSLDELLEGRVIDRPEWIEFYMVRTRELTSAADDIFRVVTSGNLGVSRRFFEDTGGFDESFDRWGMEDTEFGYRAHTRGGLLVPVRDAFCWHQGGSATPDPARKESLNFQRAKVSHLIAHPDFRIESPGRSFSVPKFVVAVDPLDRSPEVIHLTTEELLGGTVHDLVVWVGDRSGDPASEWLRRSLGPDPRVFFGPLDGALERFPHSPFHVTVPAGMECGTGTVNRLRDQIGSSAAAVGRLSDGSQLSIVRAWALHRSMRTGRPVEEVGDVVAADTREFTVRGGTGVTDPLVARSLHRSKAARVLREVAGVRSPRKAWALLRWITSAVRLRMPAMRRRGRSASAGRPPFRSGRRARSVQRAQYPLGIDIAVVGAQARSVFAATDRVHYSTTGEHSDLVLADTSDPIPDTGRAHGIPVVVLADRASRIAVPAFDPEQVNPVNWVRHTGSDIGALGREDLLPPATRVDRVVESSDREALSKLHHVEDVGGFHADATLRAATLAALAATGVVVHLADTDANLEAHLGTDLYRQMRNEQIPGADAAQRERASIAMRRTALLGHSLVARARQVAYAAGLESHPGLPEVSIILPTKRPQVLDRTLETAASQTYPRLELVLALHGSGFQDTIDLSALPFNVEVVRAPAEAPFGTVLNRATEVAGGRLLTKMDDDDHYGAEHVWDLVLARQFSKANLVAKGAEFVHLVNSDTTIHRYAGGGETFASAFTIAGGAMLIARYDLEEAGGWRRVDTAVDQALARDVARIGGRVYRTHGHGYVLVRHGEGHTWNAPDSYFLSQAQDRRPGCDLAFAGIGDW